MKRLISYFFQGLLLVAPIFITFYVLIKILVGIGSLLNILGVHIHPLIDPLLGVIMLIGVIILVGILGSSIIFRPIFAIFGRAIERAPLIKVLYTAVKDLLSAFVGSKKRFDSPVLVKLNKDSDVEKIGFITRKDLSELGITTGKVAVYLPHSYNFSGDLYIVPSTSITPIPASSAQMMKFIISGGITHVD